jgi:hypothetical protein
MRWLMVVGLLFASASSALAAPCTRDSVAAATQALGGPNLDDVHVQIEIDGLEGSVTYVMSNGDVVGPRIVKAASCRELAKSLALVIVMSWRADEPVAPAPILVEKPVAPIEPEPVIEMPPLAIDTRSVQAAPVKHIAITVGAASDASGTGAFVAGGRWRRGRLSLGLELHLTAPLSLDVGDGGSVRVSQNALDALPCFHVSRFAVCGLATGGVVGGQGRSLAHAIEVYRPSFAVGGRVEASFPVLPRVAFRLHLDALQSLASTQFLVDEMVVWTSKPRELWLGGGVVAVFP